MDFAVAPAIENELRIVFSVPTSLEPLKVVMSSPFLVTILITPANASLPQIELCGPRITSTRSILAVDRCAKLNSDPAAGSLASTPSINTSTWFASDPRMRICVMAPSPPD